MSASSLKIQHTRTQATVYVTAKAKRLTAFKCEAYVKTRRQYCTRPKESIYRTDLHGLVRKLIRTSKNDRPNGR